tara:strand:- start:4691 stop:4801 length:111 start_codon:yes stop_codon:yes gene_type:complete
MERANLVQAGRRYENYRAEGFTLVPIAPVEKLFNEK